MKNAREAWRAGGPRVRTKTALCGGVLEWLLPIPGLLTDPTNDLDVAVNTFEDPNASIVHLEHELLADRLHALLNQAPTRVWDSMHLGSRWRMRGQASDRKTS